MYDPEIIKRGVNDALPPGSMAMWSSNAWVGVFEDQLVDFARVNSELHEFKCGFNFGGPAVEAHGGDAYERMLFTLRALHYARTL